MLTSPGRGNPYPTLPGISASAGAEPLGHMLHNLGPAQLQPHGVRAPPPQPLQDRSPQGSGCPSLPSRTAQAPRCQGSSQRYGGGRWPHGDQLPYQFPLYLGFHQGLEHNWYEKPAVLPLSPFYFLPYLFPMACIQPCKLTFSDKYAYIL